MPGPLPFKECAPRIVAFGPGGGQERVCQIPSGRLPATEVFVEDVRETIPHAVISARRASQGERRALLLQPLVAVVVRPVDVGGRVRRHREPVLARDARARQPGQAGAAQVMRRVGAGPCAAAPGTGSAGRAWCGWQRPRRTGLAADVAGKAVADQPGGHRGQRHDVRPACLHAAGGKFDAGVGRIIEVADLGSHQPGDLARALAGQQDAAQGSGDVRVQAAVRRGHGPEVSDLVGGQHALARSLLRPGLDPGWPGWSRPARPPAPSRTG